MPKVLNRHGASWLGLGMAVASLAMLLLLGGNASAKGVAPQLDQESTCTPSTGNSYSPGQSFRAGKSGTLTSVELNTFSAIPLPFTVSIRTEGFAGSPVASGSGTPSLGGGWVNVPMSPAFTVTSGTTYYLVIENGSSFFATCNTDPYANGNFYDTREGLPDLTTDLLFRTYVAVSNATPNLTTNAGLTVTKGATATVTNAMLGATDADNTAAQITYIVDVAPAHGTLRKSGTALGQEDTFTQDDIDNNRITYAHDGSATTTDSLSFTVSDGAGGNLFNNTFSITVNPTYTVTYDANGGTGTAPSDSTGYTTGATVTVAGSGDLQRTSYTFSGWNTSANGTGTYRSAGSAFSMGSANVTLYAQWSQKPFTVTYLDYDAATGSVPTDPNRYDTGDTVTVLGSGTLDKPGYTFTGWNTLPLGNGTAYAPGSTFNASYHVTLYSQWSETRYTVTYDGNGSDGGTVPVDTDTHPADSVVYVQNNTGNLVRTGYQFGGWNTKADGTGTTYANSSFSFTMGPGNVTLYAKWVENTPPTGTVSINGGAKVATSANVTLTLTASSSLSTVAQMHFSDDSNTWTAWEPYKTSRNYTLPTFYGSYYGDQTVYVQFQDALGSISATVSATIFMDSQPPYGSILINGGASYTNSASVTLALTGLDGSGTVTTMRFSDNGTTWSSWETYATSKTYTLPAGDGVKTVYVQFQDAVGNLSEKITKSIHLDSTGPTGTVSINGGAAHTESTSVTLNFSVTDAGIGVDKVRFSNDNATWTDWTAATVFDLATRMPVPVTSMNYTLPSGDGTKTVYVQFKDFLGNPSDIISATTDLDTTAPTGTVSINGGATQTTSRSVTLTLSATDAVGVTEMQFSNDNSTWSTPETYATTKAYTLPAGDGNKTIYVKFMDGAGHSSSVVSASITLSTPAPPVTPPVTPPALSGNADLSGLGLSGGKLTPAFNANTTSYTATVPYTISSVTVSATAADSKAKVSGTGAATLTVGSNAITVTVTAENGTTKSYTVTITRAPEEKKEEPAKPVLVNLISGSGNGADLDEQKAERTVESTMVGTDLVVTMDASGQGQSKPVEMRAIEVPADVVQKLSATDSKITVSTSVGSISIPAASIASAKDDASSRVSYRVKMEAVDTTKVATSSAPSIQLAVRTTANAENKGLRTVGKVLSLTAERVVESSTGATTVEPIKTFAKPVTVRIPFDEVDDPASLGVYRLNEQTGEWEFRGGKVNVAERYVEIELSSFSHYTLLERVTFDDVQQHWAQSVVERLAVRRVVKGKTPRLFAPDEQITRAEFTALLVRLLKLPAATAAAQFTDVSEGTWYAADVRAAAQAGLVKGSDGHFRPEAPISRQEIVVMLLRAAELQGLKLPAGTAARLASFRDGDKVEIWAAQAMATAIEAGLMQGRNENLLAPADTATRAETAALLDRFLKYSH